jgi:hypothetical protein
MWSAAASIACLLTVAISTPARTLAQETPHAQIGIIDFYGTMGLPDADLRGALTFKEGDSISMGDGERPAWVAESERRLAALPRVSRAKLNFVCCDSGRAMVYVGIEIAGSRATKFRAAPTGSIRLPEEIVAAGRALEEATIAAAQRGDFTEDHSEGHALMHDQTGRGIQRRFVAFASKPEPLRRVLRESADANHRALAAQVLAYAADKQSVVVDLVYAADDSAANVRNDAVRALGVMGRISTGPRPRIPAEPFVRLLHSLVWTDKNKAAMALDAISAAGNPQLLETLRRDALEPLIEMARWKNPGHATSALLILGRIAGVADQDVYTAVERGNRERIIAGARRVQKH